MVNILIAGYHGFGNCGDEAILKAMSADFRKLGDDISITALSRDPDFTRKEYNINSVQRFDVKAALKAVKKCDILVLGGGTLLQDRTSTRSILYYLGLLKAACIFGKKVMLYANGIGPVNGTFNRLLTRRILRKVHRITLREKLSYSDLMNIGVKNDHITVTADAAFMLRPADADASLKLLEEAGAAPAEGSPLVGVAVRAWSRARYGEDYYRKIALACDEMAEKGCRIMFVPMQYPDDLKVSEKIRTMMKQEAVIIDQRLKPEEIMGIIGHCSLMLSMRLHALIFAAIQNVPMAGIIYDPKIDYYLKELDMPSCGDVRKDRISSGTIVSVLENLMENRESFRQTLAQRVEIMASRAEENDIILSELMDEVRKKQ